MYHFLITIFFASFRPKFLRDEEYDKKPFLVIVQCDSGHLNSDLIACARYRVCDEAIRAKSKNRIRSRDDITHVLFVIRLPQQEIKSQFVGFQGDPWISVHIDDLRPTSEATVIPEQALSASISELFIGQVSDKKEVSLGASEVQGEAIKQKAAFELEIGLEEDREKLSSSSASDDRHDSDRDFYAVDSMSNDESSLEESQKMDMDDKLHEPAHYEDSVHHREKAFEGMIVVEDFQTMEDEHFPDPALETMQLKEVPTAILPSVSSKIEGTQVGISDSLLQPVHSESITQSPTLDSFERERVPSQDIDSLSDQMRHKKTTFHPQYNRLLSCVQAAVSMLKDNNRDRSMDRIHILMALIPKVPQEQLTGDKCLK